MRIIDEVTNFYGVNIVADSGVPLGQIRVSYPKQYSANRETIEYINNLLFIRKSMALSGEEFYRLLDHFPLIKGGEKFETN